MINDFWYNSLNKSDLTPPPYVFGIVWPILYIMITLAGTYYLAQGGQIAGMLPYFTAWILNLMWSPLFFGYRRPDLSFLTVIAMTVMTGINIIEFNKVSTTSALLLVPYMLWICFATYLNGYIYIYS
jgi:benzodiazapine receptor